MRVDSTTFVSREVAESFAERAGITAQELWDSCAWVRLDDIGLVAIMGGAK